MSEIERISAAATRSLHTRVGVMDQRLIQAKAKSARSNDRRREIHILHRGDEDTLQRMLNALQPGSYIRPHRHVTPPKAEVVVVLRGVLGFVAFADDGRPDREQSFMLSATGDAVGIDYRAGVWHSYFACEEDTVVFEAKPGPYDAGTDKELAPWAPREDTSEGRDYLARLEDTFREWHRMPARAWQP